MARKIRADEMIRARDRINDALALLNDARLREIERRSTMPATPDGFRAAGSGSSTSDVSDPTLMAAVELVEGRPAPDPQLTAFRIIQDVLQDMEKSAKRAANAWRLIEHIADERHGHQSSLQTCRACLRDDVTGIDPDRLKGGYCPACHTAWGRFDGDDRYQFELSRRPQPAEQAS